MQSPISTAYVSVASQRYISLSTRLPPQSTVRDITQLYVVFDSDLVLATNMSTTSSFVDVIVAFMHLDSNAEDLLKDDDAADDTDWVFYRDMRKSHIVMQET